MLGARIHPENRANRYESQEDPIGHRARAPRLLDGVAHLLDGKRITRRDVTSIHFPGGAGARIYHSARAHCILTNRVMRDAYRICNMAVGGISGRLVRFTVFAMDNRKTAPKPCDLR